MYAKTKGNRNEFSETIDFIKLHNIYLYPVAIKYYYMKKIRDFVEIHAFGVCTAIGEKLGIATSRIRMWFIYISFLTFGSPIIIYMVLAFWMNVKKYILAAKRNPFLN